MCNAEHVSHSQYRLSLQHFYILCRSCNITPQSVASFFFFTWFNIYFILQQCSNFSDSKLTFFELFEFRWLSLNDWHHAKHLLVQHLHVIWICRSKITKLELALCSIRKVSSLCPNPFKGFTLRSESVEGLKGVGDQTTVSWSALLHHYTDAPSSCKESAQRIMGPEVSISCTLWNPSFRRALWKGKAWKFLNRMKSKFFLFCQNIYFFI